MGSDESFEETEDSRASQKSEEPELSEEVETTVDPKIVVEALLFSASSPVKAGRLAAAADLETKEVEDIIRTLNADYEQEGRAFHIIPVAKGYQMMSKPEFYPYIQKLTKARARDKLTGAALETLAIIAYKQPIIRAEVEAIRGVQSGQIIRNLLERRLIRVTGRDARLGHPLLYGTTPRFLEIFGLKSLEDLPSLEELKAF
ncbi:MAG: SMC-Scp complex subunit ScpB [Planctomycetes bacterium]|nr:SMC-Scp complex subunit ScpB [Planctomycetota bacterium]